MAKGGPCNKEVIMRQEALYTFDDSELEILKKYKYEEPQIMPTETEEIIFEKRICFTQMKCDSCAEKSKIMFYLVVGGTELIKMCPYCKRRFKKTINHTH